MHLQDFFQSISKKILLLISGIVIALLIVFFVWQQYKYKIVHETIADTIAKQTDSLYTISYDSLHFDEILGTASLKNIHIIPDTVRIKNMSVDDQPYVMLDIKIASITVTGVKTDKALLGTQMIGDSVMIEKPEITVYFVKQLKKQTDISVETKSVYDQILGNLTLIKAGQVFINNINVTAQGFFTKESSFDFINGNVLLKDVLIDSAHNLDTSRTLFSKEADVKVASFITYNNNRPELRVNNVNFQGADNMLSFNEITVNRFENGASDSTKLLAATGLRLDGIDADEFVKNKNIVVENIYCKQITLYEPPLNKLKSSKGSKPADEDTTGFRHVYSIDMKHLNFPSVNYISRNKSKYSLGNIGIKINQVKADEIIKVQKHPIDYSNEAEISFSKISLNSKSGLYNFRFRDVVLNTLKKELKIGSYAIRPFLGEEKFAAKAHFQKDRYDVEMRDIALKGIDMNDLIDEKLIASELVIKNISAKIYRDLQKPLDDKNKVGRYPSQLLLKSDMPINISRAIFSNATIEYKEKEKLSDTTGVIKFTESSIRITNITNIPGEIKKNKEMKISYGSKILGTIPVNGSFTFFLDNKAGKFNAGGNIPAFDAHLLNEVSVPMALMRINTGKINSIDFDFNGDDLRAAGKMVMKYEDLKVDVLKRDKESGEIKKTGLKSLVANIIVKNDNPKNGDLREVHPHYDRDKRKSFFNLVWKTIFTGMKKTVGIP
ncbi:MAG: hypothetical protein ABIO76_00620 [Ginsengibacter sp.]